MGENQNDFRDPCITGSPQLGVVDGLYSVIGPLSPGLHVLKISADTFGNPPLRLQNTFNLTIVKSK